MLLLWSAPALAFRIPSDICDANTIFVGRAIARTSFYESEPGVEPRHPQGRIATRFTFSVTHPVVDATGDAADGVAEVSLPGGQIGTTGASVPEMPDIDIGDRYAFAMNWLPGRASPLLGDWSLGPLEGEMPSAAELRLAREAYCSCPVVPRPTVDEKGCVTLSFRSEGSVFASWWQNDVRRKLDLRLPDCDVSPTR